MGSANRDDLHLCPTDLRFSVFSSEDIKRLSVVKVVTGLAFDVLGNSLPGGLHDTLMGASGDLSEPCTTCMSISGCPGHFGYIELNTLVYNPFFLRTVFDILKKSCLNCHKLQISGRIGIFFERLIYIYYTYNVNKK